MITRLRSAAEDVFTASVPLLGQITVAEFNQAAQALGALAGLAYLLWKWSREYSEPTTPKKSKK